MYFFSSLLAGLFFISTSFGWGTDFEKAKERAGQEHKLVLLNFSGSDWCGPCIRLHNEIFESDAFKTFANDQLILVNADFPRLKKNQLSKEQQKKNDLLANQYNKNGIFPYTMLMDAEGKIIKTWEGFPQVSPAQFVSQVKSYCDALK
jgi:thiol-disulfide isomerase/thioredoxin